MAWWSTRSARFVIGITWWLSIIRSSWLLARLRIFNVKLSKFLIWQFRRYVLNDLLVVHSFSKPGTCANLHWFLVVGEENLGYSSLIYLVSDLELRMMNLWTTPRSEHLAWRLDSILF